MAQLLTPGSILAMTDQAADRLIKLDSGDAALLYLHLLRRGSPEGLRWPEERKRAALKQLQDQGLASLSLTAAPAAPEEPPEAPPPEYALEDINAALGDRSSAFPALADEVERRLGKKLTANDLKVLYTLYDHLALPAEVICLLVNWCIEEMERKYGPGRKPFLSQIRREGFVWARKGIDTVDAAEQYLQKLARLRGRGVQVLRLLDIPPRPLVEREKKYIAAWDEMGFDDEALRAAYERTIMKKQSLDWSYMNGILRRWHEKGLHTLAAIQAGDRDPRPVQAAPRHPPEPGGRQPGGPAGPGGHGAHPPPDGTDEAGGVSRWHTIPTSCAGPPPGWRSRSASGRTGGRSSGGRPTPRSPGWPSWTGSSRGTMAELASASLRQGGDMRQTLQAVRDKNLEIQQERAVLLGALGLPEDALDDKPACPKCGDTGWRGAQMCECLKELCAQEQIQELSKLLDLGEQSFDAFRLDYYSDQLWPGRASSPRTNMDLVYEVCLNYAQKFGRFHFKNPVSHRGPRPGQDLPVRLHCPQRVGAGVLCGVYDTAGNIFAQLRTGSSSGTRRGCRPPGTRPGGTSTATC